MTTTDYNTISELELIAAKCWPARKEKNLNGWILLVHDGVTARANSVHPYTTRNNVDFASMIEEVVTFYQKYGYPPIFKMTKVCNPNDLDEILENLGFGIEMKTHFQVSDISNLTSINQEVDVQIESIPTPEWFDAYFEFSGFSDRAMSARRGIITDIKLKKALASVRVNGNIVGIGLGVVYNEWVGLFSITTSPHHYRKGIALSVNHALAIWGENLGATSTFLQVEEKNKSAQALYKKLGFKTLYNYWYRIRR
ncbi:MAG: GNAT family N-acetyltransferase [Candidatus Thorarchaeota archaeon]